MQGSELPDPIKQWADVPARADVALLSAPFTFPPIPSIALSLFKSALGGAGISSRVLYPMFPLLRLLGAEDIRRLGAVRGPQAISEYLFASLTDRPGCVSPQVFVETLFPDASPSEQDALTGTLRRARACAEQITQATALKILKMGARVLAASSIYAQQNASLAVMRRVKELDPSIVTLLGGGNVSGEMGLAVLTRYQSVDYISFGEGDETIADFCRMALQGKLEELPYGILGRAQMDTASIPHRLTRDLDRLPTPDYSDYFAEIDRERSGFYGGAAPESGGEADGLIYGNTLFLEGSRGCWWGEKHACSFCGLSGLVNVYREKTPQRLLEEIREVSAAHPGCIIQLSDNVLGPRMYKELLPALAREKNACRLSAEVRTNLKLSDVAALARAGFGAVQPGIESLNDHLLKLMGKGNTAAGHVALLKYCRACFVRPFWHMLYGIPGEEEEDYRELISLIPLLSHLSPPTAATPILFQRYSRYWLDPAGHGLELTPDRSYRLCYGDDEAFIRQTAMYYDLTGGPFLETKTKHRTLYLELSDAVKQWRALWERGSSPDLIMTQTREGVSVLDTRPCRDHLLTRLGGLSARLLRLCEEPVSLHALEKALRGSAETEQIEACARELIGRKLMVCLGNRYIALPIPAKEKTTDQS